MGRESVAEFASSESFWPMLKEPEPPKGLRDAWNAFPS
jgi:hypothetical protein